MGLVRLVFRPECTGQGLRPKPCTLSYWHMQLPFPSLQGTNQRSVHVKTDGSQIRLFWGFLFGLPLYPLSIFFFFTQPLWSSHSGSLALNLRLVPIAPPLAVNHIIFGASYDPVCTFWLVSLCLYPFSPHKLLLTFNKLWFNTLTSTSHV